ncbi:MAG: metallophosphoesterase family protein [Solirubrobacteraceae bacterium]
MRVAALYDIHANLPALEAVLHEVEAAEPDRIVIGGDAATGAMNAETLDALMALGDRALFVRGNADRWTVEVYDDPASASSEEEHPGKRAAAWAAAQISRSQRDFLASFASTVELDIEGLGRTLFCHGSPRSDNEAITAVTPDDRLHRLLDGVEARTVVSGHTHVQFDRRLGERRVVNAGSVGMPYEGRPGAHWLLLGPDVDLRRTDYDLEAAIERLRATGWPGVEEFLQHSFLEPMDPDWVSEFFERQAQEAEKPPPP